MRFGSGAVLMVVGLLLLYILVSDKYAVLERFITDLFGATGADAGAKAGLSVGATPGVISEAESHINITPVHLPDLTLPDLMSGSFM